ncbi:MAG TPA: hemolysin III family protein [Frankiaceae bacterium]|nr:hemolysin III family protein [Frankiaceae bacterium]
MTAVVGAPEPSSIPGLPLLKPRLRGHLHQWACLVSVVTGAVLVAFAPTARGRFAAIVYAASVTLLFGTSALYHRRPWSARARGRMKRLDHAMILVLAAGSFTPMAMLLLTRPAARWMLWVVWVGTAFGVAIRILWPDTPPWAAVPLYFLVGGVALLALPALLETGHVVPLALMVSAGAVYIAGGIILASHRPDPRPAVFGYHEVFHLLTLVAGMAIYVLNSIVVYGAT